MSLSPFKFFIGPGLFREQSTLYRSLDEALVHVGEYDSLGMVPSGHAPWKPFAGRPANDTSPFRADLPGRSWQVLKVFDYRDRSDPSLWYIAEFSHPADAFAFAQLKTKLATQRGDRGDTFFVCLWGWTEDGRRPEIARLPADHLAKLRRQAQRDYDRRQRLAEKRRYSVAA